MMKQKVLAMVLLIAIFISGCSVKSELKEQSEGNIDSGILNNFDKTTTQEDISLESESVPKLDSATEPESSTEPETSTEPENSTEPETSIEPEIPTEPENSMEPEIPTELETTTEPETSTESDTSTEPEFSTEKEDSATELPEMTYTYTDMRVTMWVISPVNVRNLPCTDGKKKGVLESNAEVEVTGQCNETKWYRINYDGEEAYVSNKYLADKIQQWPEITAEQIPIPELNGDSPIIVIDAGHQEFVNADMEPNGPGSSTMKKKVSRGTRGCVSEWWEYELNLVIAMKLKTELTARGYQVVMIRETHEINISNSERAMVANNINADAFIRIHANGSYDPAEQGAFTICQTPNNPYIGEQYEIFRKLADCILDGYVASTGCVKRDVWETDTMSGINWAQVPTTIIEMGYMTNAQEDALMATEEYQDKMVQGIADGLDIFFEKDEPESENNDM